MKLSQDSIKEKGGTERGLYDKDRRIFRIFRCRQNYFD